MFQRTITTIKTRGIHRDHIKLGFAHTGRILKQNKYMNNNNNINLKLSEFYMNISSLLIFNELIFYIIITLSQRPGSF